MYSRASTEHTISAGASGNITEAARNPTGKETMRMKRLLKKYNDMKYRYKLTNLLVVVSLVPMTVLASPDTV